MFENHDKRYSRYLRATSDFGSIILVLLFIHLLIFCILKEFKSMTNEITSVYNTRTLSIIRPNRFLSLLTLNRFATLPRFSLKTCSRSHTKYAYRTKNSEALRTTSSPDRHSIRITRPRCINVEIQFCQTCFVIADENNVRRPLGVPYVICHCCTSREFRQCNVRVCDVLSCITKSRVRF